ncbi:hypothetical protein MTO96_034163 [Rhipicephalus appendiculatus]
MKATESHGDGRWETMGATEERQWCPGGWASTGGTIVAPTGLQGTSQTTMAGAWARCPANDRRGDTTRPAPTFLPQPDHGPVTVTEETRPLPMNKRVPVMCTVSNAFGPSDILPRDGMCDAIFYDSLYRDGRNSLTGAYDAGLEHFLDLGQGMEFTGIGVSFDVRMDVQKVNVTSSDVASGLLKLYNRGVTHFGALRVYGTGSGEEEVIAFLSFLQV